MADASGGGGAKPTKVYDKCYLCQKSLEKSHDRYNLINEKRLSILNRNKAFRLRILANVYHLCQRCSRDLAQLDKNYEFEASVMEKIPKDHKENLHPEQSTPITTRSFGTQTENKIFCIPKTTGDETRSFIHISWPSGTRYAELPKSLNSICTRLLRQDYKSLAFSVWQSDNIKSEIVNLFLKDLTKECKDMCAEKDSDGNDNLSIFKKTTKKDIMDLSFEKAYSEMKTRCPLTTNILTTIACAKNLTTATQRASINSVAMAAAILFRNNSRRMTAFQLFFTLILNHSSYTNVLKRFGVARLVVSNPFINKKMDEFGADHDRIIKEVLRSNTVGNQADDVDEIKSIQKDEESRKRKNEEAQFVKWAKYRKIEDPGPKIPISEIRNICYDEDSMIPKEVFQQKSGPAQLNDSDKMEIEIEIESEYVSSERGEQIDSNISADFTIDNDISPREVSTPIKSKDSKQPQKKKDVIKKPVLLIYDRNFKLVIDNLDTHHKVSNMTEKNQNIDLHHTAKMAVFDRVSPPEALSDTKPHCTISELDNSAFICTPEEQVIQRLNYITIVSRILTNSIKCLETFSSCAVRHIPHEYSKEMRKKSQNIFLGIIYENENTNEGSIEVLKDLQQYQSSTGTGDDEVLTEKAVVGDQLTIERCVNSIFGCNNGLKPRDRFDGIHCEVADFHADIKIMQYAIDHFFCNSLSDACTLGADKALINRRNVGKEAKKRTSATRAFLDIEFRARIIAAGLQILKIQKMDDVPSKEVLDPSKYPFESDKKSKLEEICAQVVDCFILRSSSTEEYLKRKQAEFMVVDGKFKCSNCEKTFEHHGKALQTHLNKEHNIDREQDDTFFYQISLMEFLALWENFYDATKEGDGKRLMRCWKFLIPYFVQDGIHSNKYAIEAFYLVLQLNCLLSQKDAHSLMWNRFAKMKNGSGGNIPLDLEMEHCIRLIKVIKRKLGPNALNEDVMTRYARALNFNKDLLEKYDNENGLKRRSGKHVKKRDDQDLKKLVEKLQKEKSLQISPNRTYKFYPNMKESILVNFDMSNFHGWLNKHKEQMISAKTVR